MGTRANVVLNFGEQEVVLFANTTSFDAQEEVLRAIENSKGKMHNILVSLLKVKEHSFISKREESFFVDEAPYGDSEIIIDVRYDENRKLFMEAVWDSQFHFGIFSDNQNLSTFILRKTVSMKDMSKKNISYDFDIIYGRDILKEDRDEVKKIAIELITSGDGKEFHSVSGNTFRVVKLREEEMSNFLK
jgi:hypothetical protein